MVRSTISRGVRESSTRNVAARAEVSHQCRRRRAPRSPRATQHPRAVNGRPPGRDVAPVAASSPRRRRTAARPRCEAEPPQAPSQRTVRFASKAAARPPPGRERCPGGEQPGRGPDVAAPVLRDVAARARRAHARRPHGTPPSSPRVTVDQRVITVAPTATAPLSCSGQRRNDQRGVAIARAPTGASALTRRGAAKTRIRPSTISGALAVLPVTPGPGRCAGGYASVAGSSTSAARAPPPDHPGGDGRTRASSVAQHPIKGGDLPKVRRRRPGRPVAAQGPSSVRAPAREHDPGTAGRASASVLHDRDHGAARCRLRTRRTCTHR